MSITSLTNSAASFAAHQLAAAGIVAHVTGAGDARRLDRHQEFLARIRDINRDSIGRLVDADMAEEAARLQAQQVRINLATQNLRLLSDRSMLLSLFRPLS